MGKGGGSSRRTGGDTDGIRKFYTVGEMDQFRGRNSSSKRIKLPKKFFDDSDTVNHASVPRKIRSAMKKRNHESVSPSSPNPRNTIRIIEMQMKDCKKKLKLDVDESMAETITKDEEEVMAALVSMAKVLPEDNRTDEINLNNKTSKPEASSSSPLGKDDSNATFQAPSGNEGTNNNWSISEDFVQETSRKDSKDIPAGKGSRKRCLSHAYICHLIKDMQVIKGKTVISHHEPKQQARTNPENIPNGYTGKTLNEAQVGPKPLVPPYFGSPLYDPSQWLRPMWVSQFAPGARYEMVPTGSKCVQPSMQELVGSGTLKLTLQ